MIPTLFISPDPSLFHCDVCVISKQHRVSYPISNKIHSIPFAVIYFDMWGPSKIPNYSTARWFFSFIDDCTSMTLRFFAKRQGSHPNSLTNLL